MNINVVDHAGRLDEQALQVALNQAIGTQPAPMANATLSPCVNFMSAQQPATAHSFGVHFAPIISHTSAACALPVINTNSDSLNGQTVPPLMYSVPVATSLSTRQAVSLDGGRAPRALSPRSRRKASHNAVEVRRRQRISLQLDRYAHVCSRRRGSQALDAARALPDSRLHHLMLP